MTNRSQQTEPNGERGGCAPVRLHIRGVEPYHLPGVMAIEAESFEFPWTKKDFVRCLRQPNCNGKVAEHDGRVVGFIIYELSKTQIRLLDLAVAADCRRRSVGSQMVAKLIGELTPKGHTRIVLEVLETNVFAQLFFREQGFEATDILRNFYDDAPGKDAYTFRYRLGRYRRPGFSITNRIAGFVR